MSAAHRVVLSLGVAVAIGSFGSTARADGPISPNGTPIATSDYALDLVAGPVLSGPRALGLGGAYVAIAEGVDGNVHNPATPAVRAAWSRSHVEVDATVGLLFPSNVANSDFFNTGRERTDLRRNDQRELALIAPSGNVQVGAWGAGIGLELMRFGLLRRTSPAAGGEEELVRAQVSTFRTFLARAVDDGQLVGGLGLQVTALDLTTRDEIVTRSGNIFTTRGVSFEGGLLWRPSNQRFRIGFALRAPVTTEVDSRGRAVGGDIVLADPASGGYYLPRRVKRPWSADVGFAVQLGPRPLNVPWLDPVAVMRRVDLYLERRERARDRQRRRAERLGPDSALLVEDELAKQAVADEAYRDEQEARLERLLRDRYRSVPRRYMLLSAAVRADGALDNAVGIESFLQQRVDRSGEKVTVSPRAGVETEPVQNWLKVRAGGYWEPSRFRAVDGRAHMTGGFDARLFPWTLFGLLDDDASIQFSTAGDFAQRYFGWAISLGVWR